MATFGGENAESYYDEGLTAAMRGELELAIGHFESCIRLDNTYAAAYHQIGKAYYRMGRFKKAVSFLDQVVKNRPGQVPAMIDLAYALLNVGELNRARDMFADVLRIKGTNGRAMLGLASCCMVEGQFDQAFELGRQALNAGSDTFAAHYLMARAARYGGHPEGAMEPEQRAEGLAEKAIETSSDAPEGYFLRGMVQHLRGDLGKALDSFTSAETRARRGRHYTAYNEHFTFVDVLFWKALTLQGLEQFDSARKAAQDILEIDANHEGARALLTPGDPA